jgi:hypothetical protein
VSSYSVLGISIHTVTISILFLTFPFLRESYVCKNIQNCSPFLMLFYVEQL